MSRLMPWRVARSVLVLGLFACASSSTGATRRGSQDKLTRTEIMSSNVSNAYEAISRLRPNWLRATGTASIGGGVRNQLILVYIDNQRAEDMSALKTVSANIMESAEWIDASRIQTVLSSAPAGSYAGAILIKTH